MPKHLHNMFDAYLGVHICHTNQYLFPSPICLHIIMYLWHTYLGIHKCHIIFYVTHKSVPFNFAHMLSYYFVIVAYLGVHKCNRHIFYVTHKTRALFRRLYFPTLIFALVYNYRNTYYVFVACMGCMGVARGRVKGLTPPRYINVNKNNKFL